MLDNGSSGLASCRGMLRPSRLARQSHLSTLGHRDVQGGLLLVCADVLNLPHDIHAIDDLAEHDVLVVQKRRWNGGDEELRPIGIGPRVLAMSDDRKSSLPVVLTAMLSKPAASCFRSKFSSANDVEP